MNPVEVAYLVSAGALGVILLIIFIKTNLKVCPPDKILIFSGRRSKLPDGTKVGYKVVRSRGLKIPLVERVYEISLRVIPVEVKLQNVLAGGLVPVSVEFTANVKIASTFEKGLANAIERFLGKAPDDIAQVAKEILEGNLRGVLAEYSPEEANEKRIEVAQKVKSLSEKDFKELGLLLDTFKILSISDDKGYLEAVSVRKNAEVQKEAQIAEAIASSEARKVKAEKDKEASIKEITSKKEVVKAENEYRVHKANLEAESNRKEAEAKVAYEIAEMQEREKLEERKIAAYKKKYEAEKVIPAEAEKKSKELLAIGEAALIREEGKATAEAISLMRKEWEDGKTKELFLIRMLPDIVDKVTSTVAENMHIEKLTVVDGGEGSAMPALVKGITGSAIAILEQLKNTIGLDLQKILTSKKD